MSTASPSPPQETAPARPSTGEPHSVVSQRGRILRLLHGLTKRTVFNPYWLDIRHLRAAVAGLAPHARGITLDVGVGERPYADLFAHVDRYVGLEYPPVVFGNLNPDLWDYIHVVHGIIDVFGDGSVWAIHVPGHSPGSTAYLVRTPRGSKLLVGDASHTRWGWENGVEPGTFSLDGPRSAESLWMKSGDEMFVVGPSMPSRPSCDA